MKASDFVHLHSHSTYSLLEALPSPAEIVARAKELGLTAVGIADKGYTYGLIELYRAEPATLLVVISGSVTGTAREAVDRLRDRGIPVGLLRVRVLRPFPTEEVRRAVSGVETLLVLDRAVSYGQGGTLAQELKSALYGHHRMPHIFSGVMGLGGAPVSREMIEETILMAWEKKLDSCRSLWFGGTK